MDHITVLGHSGQAVSDIARQRLDCLPDTTTGTGKLLCYVLLSIYSVYIMYVCIVYVSTMCV